MTTRTSIFGVGRPGGRIEYPGDSQPPITSYAAAIRSSNIGDTLRVPASLNTTNSAVVNRAQRSGGMRSFYAHGAVPMPTPVPYAGYGGVNSSAANQYNVNLFDWQINPSWFEAGYPRNLGLSTRVPQLQTNITGGPGKSRATARPLFTRVQQVPRAQVTVRTYQTKAANA